MDEGVAQDDLDRSAIRLNDSLAGLSYGEIEANQLELTSLEERVKRDTSAMMRETETAGLQEHHMDGLRHLLNQPEFSQGEGIRELVELLEERVLLERVISEAPKEDDVAIYIGGENRQEALRSFGVILCRYGIPNHVGGTICVVGPTRMGYAEAIGSVRYLASVMSRLVVELGGGTSYDLPDLPSTSTTSGE